MKKKSNAGRPSLCEREKAKINIRVSPREIESLERITGLKGAKSLRHAVDDFIKRNGGYSDEQSK